MDDLISRQAAIYAVGSMLRRKFGIGGDLAEITLAGVPSAQPEYEELTPEEAASEIASVSITSALSWLDTMIRLTQMGYVICRKK